MRGEKLVNQAFHPCVLIMNFNRRIFVNQGNV